MKNMTYLKRSDRESGQGALEYLGVVVVAALIIAALAVFAPTLAGAINTAFTSAISHVSGLLGG